MPDVRIICSCSHQGILILPRKDGFITVLLTTWFMDQTQETQRTKKGREDSNVPHINSFCSLNNGCFT